MTTNSLGKKYTSSTKIDKFTLFFVFTIKLSPAFLDKISFNKIDLCQKQKLFSWKSIAPLSFLLYKIAFWYFSSYFIKRAVEIIITKGIQENQYNDSSKGTLQFMVLFFMFLTCLYLMEIYRTTIPSQFVINIFNATLPS